MKFGDIRAGDPWLETDETRALIELIREKRASAVDAAVVAVRDHKFEEASGHVGAADGYMGLLFALQPREGK
jgi:hypothetical protein